MSAKIPGTIGRTLLIAGLLLVAISYGKVSLWLWKSLENSGSFFSYFVATVLGGRLRKIAWL